MNKSVYRIGQRLILFGILVLVGCATSNTGREPASLIPRAPISIIDRCSGYVLGMLDRRISPATRLRLQTLAMAHDQYALKMQSFYSRIHAEEHGAIHLVKLLDDQPMPQNFKEMIVLSDSFNQIQKSSTSMAEVIGVTSNINNFRIQFGRSFPHDFNARKAREFVEALKEGDGKILIIFDETRAQVVTGRIVNLPNYSSIHYPEEAIKIFEFESGNIFSAHEYVQFIGKRRRVLGLLDEVKNIHAIALNLLDTQRYLDTVAQGVDIIQRHHRFWSSWRDLFRTPSYRDFSNAFRDSEVLLRDTESFLRTTQATIQHLESLPLPFIPTSHRGVIRSEINMRVAAYSIVLEDIEHMNNALRRMHLLSSAGIENAEPFIRRGRELASEATQKYQRAREFASDLNSRIQRTRRVTGAPRRYLEQVTENMSESYYMSRFHDFMQGRSPFSKASFYQEVSSRERSILYPDTHYLAAMDWADSAAPLLKRNVMVFQEGYHPILNPMIESLLSKDDMTLVSLLEIWRSNNLSAKNELLQKIYLAAGDDGRLTQNVEDVLSLSSRNSQLHNAMQTFYEHWHHMKEYEKKMFLLSLLP